MTVTAHDMAVRHLKLSLAIASLLHREASPFVEHGRSLACGLAELEVLTAGEQADWAERFERANSWLPAREKTRERARQLLEGELVAASALADDRLEHRERFTDALQTFLEIGVADWHEKRAWTERLDEVIPPPPPTPPTPKPYDACDIRAVALGPPERLGGLRITSAELFANCVVIRWHLVLEEDPGWRARVFPADHACDLADAHGPAALTDDLATNYVMQPNTIDTRYDMDWLRLKQTPEVLPGSSVFVPQVPAHATRLRVGSPADGFEIDLRTAC